MEHNPAKQVVRKPRKRLSEDPALPQWEYCINGVTTSPNCVRSMEILDGMGSEGWELICCLPHPSRNEPSSSQRESAGIDSYMGFFKRRVGSYKCCPKGHSINAIDDECKFCEMIEAEEDYEQHEGRRLRTNAAQAGK